MFYIGIDWSKDKHDIVFLNPKGAEVAYITIPHSTEGFQLFEESRQQLGVSREECCIGIETAYTLGIEMLWDLGYTQIYVLPPSVVKGGRKRFGNSGARTDHSDAALIADLLRTAKDRGQPWRPDSLLTRQMRSKVAVLGQLTRQSLVQGNRLRALLLRYYPGLLNLFPNLNTKTALAFLQAYPTPQTAAELEFRAFEHFVRQQRYPRPDRLLQKWALLATPPLPTLPETAQVYAEEAVLMAQQLAATLLSKETTQQRLTNLFEQHEDAFIFASLPGAGAFLAPALLVKFGDDRQRFPSPQGLQALAGTCPVTQASGKRRSVTFRHACDRSFRTIAQQWALSSVRHHSLFARSFFFQLRGQGKKENHAYRILANRWLAIAWRLWQDRIPYDESHHLQQRALRALPR